MLTGVLWFVGILPVALTMDWLACTRVAAYRTNYEYSYRPGKVRYALLVLVAALTAYNKVIYDPSQDSITGTLIVLVVLLVYGLVALLNVNQELIPSDLAPKRYAERDY